MAYLERAPPLCLLCPAGGFSSLKYWLPSILAPGPHGILTRGKLLLQSYSYHPHNLLHLCWVRQQTACRQGRGCEGDWNAVSRASQNAKLKLGRDQVTPNLNSFDVLCLCNRVRLLCSTSPLLMGHLILRKNHIPCLPPSFHNVLFLFPSHRLAHF